MQGVEPLTTYHLLLTTHYLPQTSMQRERMQGVEPNQMEAHKTDNFAHTGTYCTLRTAYCSYLLLTTYYSLLRRTRKAITRRMTRTRARTVLYALLTAATYCLLLTTYY